MRRQKPPSAHPRVLAPAPKLRGRLHSVALLNTWLLHCCSRVGGGLVILHWSDTLNRADRSGTGVCRHDLVSLE